jgi:4-hydroxy-tetrahydrodipicolinate synthase
MGSMPQVQAAPKIDLAGLVPAPVTPFNRDGSVDYAAIQRLGSWLGSIPGVKGLVVLGHAGEGTFLTQEEQVDVIKAFVKSVDNKIPIIAGITTEGTEVAALEAKRAKDAGAQAGLLYPSHGWLRFGYQPGVSCSNPCFLGFRLTSTRLLKTGTRLFMRSPDFHSSSSNTPTTQRPPTT